MPGISHSLVGVGLALMALVFAGCGSSDPSDTRRTAAGASSGEEPILLLAAASTADAVEKIARLFQKQNGVEVKISAGPSSGLARQILAGAPADVFISASEQWGEVVEAEGMVEESRILLANQLALVVPAGNPARVTSPADLTSDAVKKIALAGERVPAGMYADQALTSLGLHEPLTAAGKIVRGHDVRVTLGYVRQGEVEAAIVYATDAKITDKVEAVYIFPADSHEAIRYPALLLKRAGGTRATREFYNFLFTESAAEVLRDHGFVRVESVAPAGAGN